MPIKDYSAGMQTGQTGPLIGGFDITPDDGNDLAIMTRSIMVTVGGDVAVVSKDNDSIILPGFLPGVVYPFRVRRVLVTGTTATGIKGFY